MIGYSLNVVNANKEADQKLPGVRLGRLCIQHDIPIEQIAKKCGVSRVTIYSWFKGAVKPTASKLPTVMKLIDSLNAK